MNYLEIELSLRTWMILGGISTIAIVLIAAWVANRYNKTKQNR